MTKKIVIIEFIQFQYFYILLPHLENRPVDILGFYNGNLYKALLFYNKLFFNLKDRKSVV